MFKKAQHVLIYEEDLPPHLQRKAQAKALAAAVDVDEASMFLDMLGLRKVIDG